MSLVDRLDHRGFAQKINESRGNLVLILFSTLMLAFFLSTHVVPYLVSNADNDIAFVLDIEDSNDGEESDNEEVAVASKHISAGLKIVSARLNDYSGLMVEHQLPLPSIPYLETICPPPDWV